jgi:hypothetical protein
MTTSINDNLQVQAGEGMWTPPSTVTDHIGGKLPPESDFFVKPPREIGEIKSAFTSLKRGASAKPTPTRVAIAAVWGAAGFIIALGIQRFMYLFMIPASMTNTPVWVWEALFACLPAYIGWRKSAFKHFCHFVGTDGCAQLTCFGQRENITENSIFCFKNAAAISTSTIRHIKNGMYQYTNFYFRWFPQDSEKEVYQISGSHSSDTKTPPVGNAYNFARAAEGAWYEYLIPKADADLAREGYLKFHMGHNRHARLGWGYIEIVEKDGTVNRCEAGDIGSAKLVAGNFTLTRKDAKSTFFGLLGSTGTFQFDYSNMYNGRLFLFAFERFLDIKVG